MAAAGLASSCSYRAFTKGGALHVAHTAGARLASISPRLTTFVFRANMAICWYVRKLFAAYQRGKGARRGLQIRLFSPLHQEVADHTTRECSQRRHLDGLLLVVVACLAYMECRLTSPLTFALPAYLGGR